MTGNTEAGAHAPGARRVELPDGRILVVRAVYEGDIDGLGALYDALTVDELHDRFFSVYHPDRRFLEKVTTIAGRGGYGLVAVASDAHTAPAKVRLVAEAGYELLPNGDGQLAITVAPDWRGWLGPFLLDALLESAALRDVPNLEADILVTNTPMLTVARARGIATMPSDDWVSTRIVMGTRGRVPCWPVNDTRPRVLVETPGGRWRVGEPARRAGLQVLACSGPRPDRPRCPVLDGRPCPLAAAADAIVVSHPRADEEWAAVADAHPARHPGVPVCVEGARPSPGASPPAGAVHVPDHTADPTVVALVQRLAQAHAQVHARAEPKSP